MATRRSTAFHPTLSPALTLTIRGRSMRLRGLKQPPAGMRRWLALVGPGLIAAMAGNDAGGIATHSSAGARFGYELLWVLIFIAIALAVVQETAGRLGAATGRGLLELVRERYGLGWATLLVAVVLIANGSVVVTEFIGVAAAAELLGVSGLVAVPVSAALLWYVVMFGNYRRVEKGFLVLALAYLAYPIAAVLAAPDWSAVARGAVPIPRLEREYVALALGMVGTMLAPYVLVFQQSSIVERGVSRRRYGQERADTYLGASTTTLVAAFIVIATGATLHTSGVQQVSSAAEAARALEPVAGAAAQMLFALGLLGASLLAAGVLPLATAYSVSEAFGFPRGLDLDFRRSVPFYTLFTGLVVLGAGLAMVPGVPRFTLLIGVQVLNGILLPFVLVFLLLLSRDTQLIGSLRNGVLRNALGWTVLGIVSLGIVVMLGSLVLDTLT